MTIASMHTVFVQEFTIFKSSLAVKVYLGMKVFRVADAVQAGKCYKTD